MHPQSPAIGRKVFPAPHTPGRSGHPYLGPSGNRLSWLGCDL